MKDLELNAHRVGFRQNRKVGGLRAGVGPCSAAQLRRREDPREPAARKAPFRGAVRCSAPAPEVRREQGPTWTPQYWLAAPAPTSPPSSEPAPRSSAGTMGLGAPAPTSPASAGKAASWRNQGGDWWGKAETAAQGKAEREKETSQGTPSFRWTSSAQNLLAFNAKLTFIGFGYLIRGSIEQERSDFFTTGGSTLGNIATNAGPLATTTLRCALLKRNPRRALHTSNLHRPTYQKQI